MYWTLILVITSTIVLLLGRIFYIIWKRDGRYGETKLRNVKTLVVLGSGGHTTEILQIVKNLNLERYKRRIYVRASSDKISAAQVDEIEKDSKDYEVIEIFRSREVGQSYVTSVWTTLVSLKDSMKILWNSKPDLILCNGPGTCVPICLATFLMKVLFVKKATIIFVESFCRVKTFSLSGKILYYIADHVIVQWPQLYKHEQPSSDHRSPDALGNNLPKFARKRSNRDEDSIDINVS